MLDNLLYNLRRYDNISGDSQPHSIIRYTMLMLASLMLLLPAASASSECAKDIQLTGQFVKATALCSCGSNGYHYMTGVFENYCPKCHSHGTLTFNPKGTPEGEWTCSSCDTDYCAADGKEKISGSNFRLIPYTNSTTSTSAEPEVHAQEVSNVSTEGDILSKLALYSKNLMNI